MQLPITIVPLNSTPFLILICMLIIIKSEPGPFSHSWANTLMPMSSIGTEDLIIRWWNKLVNLKVKAGFTTVCRGRWRDWGLECYKFKSDSNQWWSWGLGLNFYHENYKNRKAAHHLDTDTIEEAFSGCSGHVPTCIGWSKRCLCMPFYKNITEEEELCELKSLDDVIR
jgi:hypothetical protein